jgi:2-polyprenyl-3-methyl-5-hydroxy-6-metoxy-1,4-benzoquinol methylase
MTPASEFRDLVRQPGGLRKRQYSRRLLGTAAIQDWGRAQNRFVIGPSPYATKPWGKAFVDALGNLRGKRVLQFGCALGEHSVFMQRHGATVIAAEPCYEALVAATRIANLNHVSPQFLCADAPDLKFLDESFDYVIGYATLHHLSEPDVQEVFRVTSRVLKPGGKAIFLEGIENSALFGLMQNIVPKPGTRPSLISRSKWNDWLRVLEERDMRTSEFLKARNLFRETHIRGFGLTSRLKVFVRNRERLERLDEWLLRRLRFLEFFSQTLLVVFVK